MSTWAAGLSPIAIGAYRVVVVEPDDDWRRHTCDLVDAVRKDRPALQDAVYITALRKLDEASSCLDAMYVDLLIIGLPDNEGTACAVLELIALLDGRRDRIKIVLTTSRLSAELPVARAATTSSSVVDFLDRTDGFEAALQGRVGELLQEFVDGDVGVLGLDAVAHRIEQSRERYPESNDIHGLRHGEREIGVEIDRLCRRVFGWSGSDSPSRRIQVELAPFDQFGESASSVVKAVITPPFDADTGPPPTSFICVLKLGPARDSAIEAARHHRYVRFGLHPERRVELLGSAVDRGLGAIAYSFASGLAGRSDMRPLNEVMQTEETEIRNVLETIFRGTDWYESPAMDRAVEFHDDAFGPAILRACRNSARNLADLARNLESVKFEASTPVADLQVQVRDTVLVLPGQNFLVSSWASRKYPRCTIHGDMHGENVLVEVDVEGDTTGRAYFIDYRSTGPGPRCLDAAALEMSIRIAQAKRIGAGFEERRVRSGAAYEKRLARAALATHDEHGFYAQFPATAMSDDQPLWMRRAGIVTAALADRFDGTVTRQEYLTTALLYAVRQLQYPTYSPLVRIRLCAWLSALYAQLRHLTEGRPPR